MIQDKLQVDIGYNTDVLSFEDALSNYNAVMKGYTFPISDVLLTPENYEKFIECLSEKYDLTFYDFSENSRNVYKQIMSPEFIMYVTGTNKNTYVSVLCKTLDISEDVFAIYKKFHNSNSEVNISMTTYFNSGSGIGMNEKILSKEEINSISTSYYPYIDTDLMFKQFFSLQENILILTGAPGLGKSKMASAILKYAADNDEYLPYDKVKEHDAEVQYVNVAYVKSTKVLSDDNFWRELEQGYYDFVIMDDLDYFLTKRDAEIQTGDDVEKNQFLNQFLSFTDGIEKNKTKFIITTNQPFDDLDVALLRKGRLFDILELRALKFEEAEIIWKENELEESIFNKNFSGDKILAADLGSEISKHKNVKVNDSLDSYLKEDGISKIEKAKQVKKVGL